MVATKTHAEHSAMRSSGASVAKNVEMIAEELAKRLKKGVTPQCIEHASMIEETYSSKKGSLMSAGQTSTRQITTVNGWT